eukprot:TRINITY_DN32998_c0_g1_i1.p1 TRINITY_DN32998_c0_g1~~TRINITY_DN32998_c0_g1_i1.p1  ORF type:complete len:264 (-),score=46.90 TRINITY_DN32998_c0_g1_i1:82-873(-)
MHTSSAKLTELTQAIASDSSILSGETRHFQVEIPLPADMLGTMKVQSRQLTCPRTKRYNNACVVWHAGVSVFFKDEKDAESCSKAKEIELMIVQPLIPGPAAERVDEVQPLASCFCCAKGELQLVGKLSQSSYQLGDKISVSCGMENRSSMRCKDILVEVWQHGMWEANGRKAHDQWRMSSIVVDDVPSSAGAGDLKDDEMKVLEISLPSDGPFVQSMDVGHIFVHHFVLLTPRFGGGSFLTKAPSLRLPFDLFCNQTRPPKK